MHTDTSRTGVRTGKSIACSYVPIAWACPHSVDVSVSIDTYSEPAEFGRFVHAIIANYFKTGEPIETIACRLAGAYSKEVGLNGYNYACYLASRAIAFYNEYSSSFHHGQTEVERLLARDNLVGIVDWIRITPHQAYIIDWKTGQTDNDLTQLYAYAYIAKSIHNAPSTWVCMVNLRSMEYNAAVINDEQLEAWKQSLEERLRGKNFNIGPWCQYCKRALTCPAIDTALDSIEKRHDADSLPQVYAAIRAIERRCRMALESLKARVHALGGQVSSQDLVLSLKEYTTTKIKTQEAWSVLAQVLPVESLLKCVEIKKTDLESEIAANTPRGKKSEEIDRVMEVLKQAGAIEERTYTSLAISQRR